MSIQGALGQQLQGGGTDHKKLENERRWGQFKDFISRGVEGAKKGASGQFGNVDPATGKKTYANKMEEMSDMLKSKQPSPEASAAMEAPAPESEQPEAKPFEPAAVQQAKFGEVNSIKPMDFSFEDKMAVLQKLIGR